MKISHTRSVTFALTLGAAAVVLLGPGLNNCSQAAPRGGRRASATASTATSSTTAPNANATPCPPSSGAGAAGASAGASDNGLLAAAMGRTLTTTENAAIMAAASTRDTAIANAENTFESSVAGVFGVTVTQLRAAVQTYLATHYAGASDLVSLLQAIAGRALTASEVTAIQTAMQTRDASVQAAVATYKSSVAAALGTTSSSLQDQVRAVRQSQQSNSVQLGGGQRGGGPGAGPGGGRGGPGGRGR